MGDVGVGSVHSCFPDPPTSRIFSSPPLLLLPPILHPAFFSYSSFFFCFFDNEATPNPKDCWDPHLIIFPYIFPPLSWCIERKKKWLHIVLHWTIIFDLFYDQCGHHRCNCLMKTLCSIPWLFLVYKGLDSIRTSGYDACFYCAFFSVHLFLLFMRSCL